MRRYIVSCAVLSVVLCTRTVSAAVVDATWQLDGNGFWSTATNWDVGVVPSNNGTDQYNVRIDNDTNFNVSVSLNINPTINNLIIDPGDALGIIDGRTLSAVGGTITNNGLLRLESGGNYTDLRIANGTTLNGTGSLVLGGHPNNRVYGFTSTDELINSATHTISGSGQLGVNTVKLTNQGTINANLGQPLYVDPSASGATNTGTMQASGGGVLYLNTGTFNNTGLIQALDNSQVALGGLATVVGGTLSTSGSGKIVVPDGQSGGLAGTITNNGLLRLESGGNYTDLRIANGTTLNGTGSLVLGGHPNNRVYGFTSTDELINSATHTISGSGQLGVNTVKLTNQGTINANLGQPLYVDPSASGATNTGTMQASGGGVLYLNTGTFNNTGLIQALDNSQVALGGLATVVGGTLSTSGSGKIVVPDGQSGGLAGTITNNGLLRLESGGNYTDLRIANGTTLNGTGSLVLGGHPNNRVYGFTSTDELINSATHTISGSGQLGVNTVKLTNQGTINANLGQPLYVDPSASGATNTGTMQASGGGVLYLNTGTFNNTGLIQALDNSQVALGGLATVVGGTLSTSGSGRIYVQNAESGGLAGTITNNGLLRVESTGSLTDLRIANGTTLNGTGSLVLGGHSNNRVYGFTSTDELINSATHTISGGGNLGSDNLKLTNQGTIDANFNNVLVVNPSASGVTNTGTMQASGGGTLYLYGGTFDNQGKIAALNGSNVLYDGTAVTTNNVAGVLTGGKWHAVSTGSGATLTLRGSLIHTIAADTEVELNGAGSVIQVAATPIDSTLTTNHGSFSVTNGRNFTAPSAFNNTGTLTIGTGSTFTAPGGFTQAATGTLQGAGTFQGNLTNPGVIGPGTSTGILTINGTLTQTSSGSLEIEVGGATAESQHDKLVVTGNAALGGELFVPIVNGYVPQVGDSVTILTSPNVTGKFASLAAPDLAIANPNVAIQVARSTTDVQLHFVTPLTNTQFAPSNAVIDWADSGAWSTGVEPDSRHVITIENPMAANQRVDVQNDDAFVHELVVKGDSTHAMTLNITNERKVSATVRARAVRATVVVDGSFTSPNVDLRDGGNLRGKRVKLTAAQITGNSVRESRQVTLSNRMRDNRRGSASSLPQAAGGEPLELGSLVAPGLLTPGEHIGQIEVFGNYEQDEDSFLEMEIESLSSFDKLIVTDESSLAGTLDVLLLNSYTPQAGDSFDLFDWGTVVGDFDVLHLPLLAGGLTWNTDQLYTLGTLAIGGVLGDYNLNGVVDAADYVVWRKTAGQTGAGLAADGSGPASLPDGVVDQLDYDFWRANLGKMAGSGSGTSANAAVPEPATAVMLIFALAGSYLRLRRIT